MERGWVRSGEYDKREKMGEDGKGWRKKGEK